MFEWMNFYQIVQSSEAVWRRNDYHQKNKSLDIAFECGCLVACFAEHLQCNLVSPSIRNELGEFVPYPCFTHPVTISMLVDTSQWHGVLGSN